MSNQNEPKINASQKTICIEKDISGNWNDYFLSQKKIIVILII